MPMPLLTAAVALALGARPLVPAAAGSSPPSGQWRWPLAGAPVVARPFEPPPGPWAAGHRGVDLAAAPESPVLSAGAGVVSFAGYVAGTGVVSVRHADGLRTTYEPVLPAVHAGASVAAGDLLGHLMPGHGDCGPARWCLHWGLLRGSIYLDPLTLVRHGPVRLLPLSSSEAVLQAPDADPARGIFGPPLAVTRLREAGTPATSTAGGSEAWSAPAGGDVTRFPETGPPAPSTADGSEAWSAPAGGDVTRFPETGTPPTSTGLRARAVGEWLSSGAGVAGLLAWWATRSPLGRGRLRGRAVTGPRVQRRSHGAARPRPA